MGKRANGEGSVYKTKDGKWRAVIDLGTGADGKRRRRSRVASRRSDALTLLRKLHAELDAGHISPDSPRHSQPSGDMHLLHIPNDPASLYQLPVDLLPGSLFWSHAERVAISNAAEWQLKS